MPNYPYLCQACGKRFSRFLSYEEYNKAEVSCPHCGSAEVSRRIARVRMARSDESRLDSLSDPAALAGIEDDPKALGKMMRQMSSQLGEDMGGEFKEVVNRLESGQSPEQIEKDLPGLGGDDGFDD